MIAKAQRKYLRTSPQKVRLVVDQIRGKPVEDALSLLRFSTKMVARDLERLLKSAVANAEQREERVDIDRLLVSRAFVDVAPTLKRVRFRAMGRTFRILKRSSHVTFELDMKARPARPGAPAPEEPVPPRPGHSAEPGAKKAPVGKKKVTARKTSGAGTKKKKNAAMGPARSSAPAARKKKTTKKTGGKKS